MEIVENSWTHWHMFRSFGIILVRLTMFGNSINKTRFGRFFLRIPALLALSVACLACLKLLDMLARALKFPNCIECLHHVWKLKNIKRASRSMLGQVGPPPLQKSTSADDGKRWDSDGRYIDYAKDF